MRLLQVIARMDPGGAEDIVVRLAAAARQRWGVAAVAAAPGRWVPRLHDAGVTFLPLVEPGIGVDGVRSLASLRRALRWQPDLVHTHNVKVTAALRVARTARRPRVPVLTTVHGMPPEQYSRAAPLLRASTEQVIACAPAVAAQLRQAGFPQARLSTIVNGARREQAPPARVQALRDQLEVPAGPTVVGVGRLVPQKAWHLLIEALAGMDEVTLVIAGEGDQRPRLEQALAHHQVRGRLPGHVEDVAALLGMATVVCQVSPWEGLPLSLLEAASVGCPIVARAVDGVADVLPPEAALLLDTDDPARIGAAIRQVLEDDQMRQGLAGAALLAARGWTPEHMVDQYLQRYAQARPTHVE
jgi:glycosyltransferase involved in cell wall biosynthesis